jgi:hypothetical protein
MAEIKLSDLPYGSLNNLEDNSSGDSGDRRRTGATTFLRFAVEKVFGKDTLDNVAELNGVIVSYRPVAYPSYKNRTAMFEEFVYKINETGDEEKPEENPKKYASFAYKVYIPELECRPAPKSFNDPVLITYPDIYSDVEGTQNLPLELGTLVAVKYEDINNLFNPRIVRKVGGPIQIENIASEAINEAFRKGIPATIGSSTNIVYTSLLPDLQELSPDEYVTSDTPVSTNLTQVVEQELSFWSGKTEKDPDAYSRLKTYWDNVGWFLESEGKSPVWSPSGVPWSAAYISYVLTRVDSQFPKAAAHYAYSESAKKGTGNWSLWKTNGNSIEAQIGDILVKKRTGKGASSTSTHGDVVYKIQDGYAYLSGGNLGNTAKGNIKLQVNGQGRYAGYGPYEILLKKNGKVAQQQVS